MRLTKKDFSIDWFSGTGKGGQHRNKHQNCCRITHLASGITVNGTASRSRVDNQREAFTKLARLVVAYLLPVAEKQREKATQEIRIYHEPRNTVKDHASGLRMEYREVVTKGNIGPMIEARRTAQTDDFGTGK